MKLLNTLFLLILSLGAFQVNASQHAAQVEDENFTLKEACNDMAPIFRKAAQGVAELEKAMKRALVKKLVPYCMMNDKTGMFSVNSTVTPDQLESAMRNILLQFKPAIEKLARSKQIPTAVKTEAQPLAAPHAPVIETQPLAASAAAAGASSTPAVTAVAASVAKPKGEADLKAAAEQNAKEESSQLDIQKKIAEHKTKIKSKLDFLRKLNFSNADHRAIIKSFENKLDIFKRFADKLTLIFKKQNKDAAKLPIYCIAKELMPALIYNAFVTKEIMKLIEQENDETILASIRRYLNWLIDTNYKSK